MSGAIRCLFGAPIYSDVGVLYTPTLSDGSWVAGLPLTNLQSREMAKRARSATASPADTRFRCDLKTDRLVRIVALPYRSPEHTGAPSTAAKVRYFGIASTVLFSSEAGDDIVARGGTFTRATVATYVDAGGVLRSVASGIPRESHYIGGVRHLLLEAASTNVVLQSENFGVTWALGGTPTRVAAAHTASGVTLDLIGDDSAAGVEGYAQNITFTGNGTKGLSLFVKQGSATSSVVRVRDLTAAADRLLAAITWSGGVPSVTAATGTFLGLAVDDAFAGGVYRLRFTTASVTAANTNEVAVFPATTNALAIANTGDLYAGGVDAENVSAPTSYIKTTTATVARNADSLSFPTIATAGTIYQKYWDLATLAYVETTGVYSSGAAIPFTTGRAYVATRIAAGTKTQAEMQALVYDSGWLTPYPAGKTIEDTEGFELGAYCVLGTAQTMRYVSVQIDDSLNAAGFIDLDRLAITGGVQSATSAGVADGAKFGLETATQNTDGDTGATFSVRKPTRRNVSLLLPEQIESEAIGVQLPFQFVTGIDRQFVFVWDPADSTHAWLRTFIGTLKQLSEFTATDGFRWGIPYVIREAL